MDDRKNWEHKAKIWATQCEQLITSWSGYENFTLSRLSLDWSTKRRASRGGMYAHGPGISIAMSQACMPRMEVFRMYEYRSFDADPVIGGFYARDENLALGLHVCHEMAHAAQFYGQFVLGVESSRPHGKEFKIPYSKIRKNILNNHIPRIQHQLKQEYDDIITSIVGKRYA